MKKINYFLLFLLVTIFAFTSQCGYAEGESVNLVLQNAGVEIFSGAIALPDVGMADVNDTDGNPHSVDARSVLNVINNADALSENFNISNLMYYSSFGAFYLKCITATGIGDLCDNWQYKVNGVDPSKGMDQEILSGGENVSLVFGIPDPASTPEVVPEKVVASPVQYTSGGGGGSYRMPITPTPAPLSIVESPMPVQALDVTPVPVAPSVKKPKVKKIIKKIAQAEVKPIKDLSIKNEAAVVSADTSNGNNPTPEKKHGWVRSFFGWLFGF